MSDIRIGSRGCSVNDVTNLVLESKSISEFYNNWTFFARKLDLPEEFINDVSRKSLIETLKYPDILPTLLHRWIARESDKATLSSLIEAFRKCKLKSIADLLYREYFSRTANCLDAPKIPANNVNLVVSPSASISNSNSVTIEHNNQEAQQNIVDRSLNGQKGVTRRILQRARNICTFRTGHKSKSRLIRKANICVRLICHKCCLVIASTFSFVFPLFLVLSIIYQMFILPNIIATSPHPTKTTSNVAIFSVPNHSTSIVVPNNTNTATEFPTSISNYSEYPNGSAEANIPEAKPIIVPSWVSLNATVESWQDFVKLMTGTNSNEEIDLTINFDNVFKWAEDLSLYNSHRIKNLWIKGHISLDNLANLVKQMPLLQNLVLDNSENKLCARNKGQLLLVKSVKENSVHLPILEKLWLKGFSNCVEILESLVWSYDCMQLKSLIIEEHVDNHNIHHVQELIAKYKTIKYLELYFVNSSTEYFYKKDVPMEKVTRLHYKMLSASGQMTKLSVGLDFCEIFVNVLNFQIGSGCIAYKELENLLLCKKLKYIKIAICIDNDDVLRDIELRTKLVSLEYISINLQFSDPKSCPSIAKVRRLGLNNVGEKVKEMFIVSNCPIKRDKNGIEYKSDFKQFRI